ncbi:MAG: aspartate dehydrogenase [Mogibacterium sp.]|nr:aspartate dehydrogenase [Mogibacterium sp.]
MGLFSNKNKNIPAFDSLKKEPVLRCSICTGEQVLCIIDRESGEMEELAMITSPDQLARICKVNNVDPSSVRKIY